MPMDSINIKMQYKFTELADKLTEIQDMVSASRKAKTPFSYPDAMDAISQMTNEAVSILNSIRDANYVLAMNFRK